MIGGIRAAARVNARGRIARFLDLDQVKHAFVASAARNKGILARLDTVKVIEEMDLPGYRLHPLKGELQGFYAVTVQANWRVIFRFEQGDVFDVDYVDYH